MPCATKPILLSSLALLLAGTSAIANDRRFGYSYETATMPKGAKELEVWSTARVGRDEYYSRLDHKLEFEAGVTDNLQTAFYLKWRNITKDDGTGNLATDFDWKGVASEWKYKFSDPVADVLGFALYGEVGYNTDEIELEAKTLFDKAFGSLLVAVNFVGELVYANSASEMELEEIELEADLGISYAFSKSLSAGLELRNHNEFAREATGNGMEFEHSALFLGPVVAYSAKSWWMTFTLLPQIHAAHAPGNRGLVLDEHEVIEARLLFSIHL